MAYTLSERSFALNWFVNGKIRRLQREIMGEDGNEAAARAQMARLRRLITGETPSLLTLGDLVLSDWPIDELGDPAGSSRELRAACVAFGAYAVLQQGKGYGVAVFSENDAERRANSFGRACWQIQPDQSLAAGVMRRLASIEGSSDFSGVISGVRSLLGLMKSARTDDGANRMIRLDFGLLAADLYEMQGPAYQRERAISRWGSAYFVPVSHGNKQDEDNE